jgi:phenylalanine-4-hydroxylase
MLHVTIRTPLYTEEDHQTWSQLCHQQWALIQGHTCQLFMEGFPKLGLSMERLPVPQEISNRLHAMTGWTLGDAQNAYLSPTEWFEHIAACRFPVTDYIRRPHELAFTPNPDLFHEYFGHLAFFTDPSFAEDARLFGVLYLSAQEERQRLSIARLWWYTLEFGLIREAGELKCFGAGLLSSPGEFLHSRKAEIPRLPFDIAMVAETPGAAYAMHEKYFILDDYGHPRRIIMDYARMENLPLPQ